MAGILLLGSFSDGFAQGSRRDAAGATVTASARLLDPVEVRQYGALVDVEEGNVLSVSSELGIAGRVPVVMAAHVQPAPVQNRWAPEDGSRSSQREAAPVATPEVEQGRSPFVPVSRHSVKVSATEGDKVVSWYVAVVL